MNEEIKLGDKVEWDERIFTKEDNCSFWILFNSIVIDDGREKKHNWEGWRASYLSKSSELLTL